MLRTEVNSKRTIHKIHSLWIGRRKQFIKSSLSRPRSPFNHYLVPFLYQQRQIFKYSHLHISLVSEVQFVNIYQHLSQPNLVRILIPEFLYHLISSHRPSPHRFSLVNKRLRSLYTHRLTFDIPNTHCKKQQVIGKLNCVLNQKCQSARRF